MRVGANTVVTIEYTARLPSGEVADSTERRGPVAFTVGQNEMLPGLERALMGLEAGDRREVELEPEDAYGRRRKELVRSLPLHRLPEKIHPVVGMRLRARGAKDSVLTFTITGISDSHVTADFNHPLAGKRLTFEVHVVTVKKKRVAAAAER